jgi:uncharacterized protein YndB with AHSA1/START domain
MMPDLDPNTDLSFTRTLAVPRQLVWECWTRPEHIPHFFVPAPHKVTMVEIDLRVGGRFNTTFEIEGNMMENRGVLEVVENEKPVFSDAFTEGWKPAPDPFMTAILILADAPDGGTTYTAIARHRNPDSRKAHEDMGFYDGRGTVVTQLEAYAMELM